MWYASPGNQGWGSKPASRKPSIMEADLGTLSTTSGSIKRSAGRVIRIVNNLDHSVQVSNYMLQENNEAQFFPSITYLQPTLKTPCAL